MRVRLALSLSVFALCALSASMSGAQPAFGDRAATSSEPAPLGSSWKAPIFESDVAPAFRSAQDLETALNTNATPVDAPDYDGRHVTGGGWRVPLFAVPATTAPAPVVVSTEALSLLAGAQAAQRPRPVAFEYSEGYQTRRKIHVYASLAMLPLFVTQYALGDSLYGNSTDGKRTAHAIVGSSIGVLFGLNTVTGVWNLWEGRKNPEGKARRLTHGLMMLGADAGFFATALLAPGDDGGGNRDTHRAVALTSMGVATASYLFMLLTR